MNYQEDTIRIPTILGYMDYNYLNAGSQTQSWFCCADTLHEYFDFPEDIKTLDFVVSTTPHEDAFEVWIRSPSDQYVSILLKKAQKVERQRLYGKAHYMLSQFQKAHHGQKIYISIEY